MWDSRCNTRLRRMQHHYRENFAALSTNSQLAERDVKGVNFCSLTNRPEYLSSAYATARADLVATIHRRTCLKLNANEVRSGNRYVLSGKVGERKRANGETYEENSTDEQRSVMGQSHSEEAINFILERHDIISNACKSDEEERKTLDRLRSEAKQKENQFSEKRIQIKTEQFKQKFNQTRPPNKIQKRSGTEITPFMQGKVPFHNLKKDRDWPNLNIELVHRNLSTEGNWTACKTRLMENEGDRKNFKIQSGAIFPWYHNT